MLYRGREDFASRGALHELVIVSVVNVNGWRILWHIFDCVFSSLRGFCILAFRWRQVSIELLYSQAAQRFVPEHVSLSVIQKIVRIWVFRMSFKMRTIARVSARLLPVEDTGTSGTEQWCGEFPRNTIILLRSRRVRARGVRSQQWYPAQRVAHLRKKCRTQSLWNLHLAGARMREVLNSLAVDSCILLLVSCM